MSNQTSSSTIAANFAEVRDALFRWEDHDKSGQEYYTHNLCMVERATNTCTCAIIPYDINKKVSVPKADMLQASERNGFVLVKESWSDLFPAHHVSCAVIPSDKVWTPAIHEKNVKRFFRYMKEAYEDEATPDTNERAREMIAIRRQLIMYGELFPESNVNPRPTQYESVLVVDAKLNNHTGPYIDAIGQYIAKFKPDELNQI